MPMFASFQKDPDPRPYAARPANVTPAIPPSSSTTRFASAPVTFELELTAEEDPAPVGAKTFSSLPVQVSLNPGQIKDVDVNMPITSWGSLVD